MEEGTILLGGAYSEATSEIVRSDDGFTEFMFDLKYETQYVSCFVYHNFKSTYLFIARYSCSIQGPSSASVIMSGGRKTLTTVSRYGLDWRAACCLEDFTVLYFTVLYCTALYYTVLYCTVL